MQRAVDEAMAGIEVQEVRELLAVSPGRISEQDWGEALTSLELTGRSVVPRWLPADMHSSVLTYGLDGTFGPLLNAAARFVEAGSHDAAERTAREARTIKALTTAPHLRHYREEAPVDSSPDVLLRHRIGAEGNGFLVMSVAELVEATGPRLRDRSMIPTPQPTDPNAYVLIWDRISAPALVMSGVNQACTHAATGPVLLRQHLITAAQALVPGAPRHERP